MLTKQFFLDDKKPTYKTWELRSSSRSKTPERPRKRRRVTTPSPSISPPKEQENTSTPEQQARVSASRTLSEETIRYLVNKLSWVNTPAQNRNRNQGWGRRQAHGWGRGRWVNFGFYLPHPGPYMLFCRVQRVAGCLVSMYFLPNANFR